MMQRIRSAATITTLGIMIMVGGGMLLADDHPAVDAQKGWKPLFNGKDLTGWEMARPGSWVVEDGVLSRKGGADLWTLDEFGDFILDLEFKVGQGTNSGVCLRVKRDPEIQPIWRDGALEIQMLDSCGSTKPSLQDSGALYDLVAPSKNVMRKAGEWNRLTVTAIGSRITVVMNGERVVDADLEKWTEAHKNPDGTPNKYAKAMKDYPRKGYIFLQEHGDPVWFRKIWIKSLDPEPQAAASKQ
ncbi:MAG: DUF1080 domain-containing protein [Thermoguttaceae bacterium]